MRCAPRLSLTSFFDKNFGLVAMLFVKPGSWRADEYNEKAGPEEMYPLFQRKGVKKGWASYGVDPCSLYLNYHRNMKVIYSARHQRALKQLCDDEVGQSEAREISSIIDAFLIPTDASAFIPMANFNMRQFLLRRRKHAKDTKMQQLRLLRMIRQKKEKKKTDK